MHSLEYPIVNNGYMNTLYVWSAAHSEWLYVIEYRSKGHSHPGNKVILDPMFVQGSI